jgi:hypothetical protein
MLSSLSLSPPESSLSETTTTSESVRGRGGRGERAGIEVDREDLRGVEREEEEEETKR